MAMLVNLSDSDRSVLSDQSVSSRTSARSLRVAEKERKKNEAEDPFVSALKYFSEGGSTNKNSWIKNTLNGSQSFHRTVT